MPSFRQFILAHKDEYSPQGDLARDLLQDECAKGLSSYKSLRRHMDIHRACYLAYETIDDLYLEFKREVAKAKAVPQSLTCEVGSLYR